VLAEMTSHTVILNDAFDLAWHRRYAVEHMITWEDYAAAVDRSPKMSYEQLEGAATLMGMIANTIANLAHQNLALKREMSGVQHAKAQQAKEREQLVARATAVMHERLEDGVTIEGVAKAVAVSSTFLGAMFMEQLGASPLHVLNEMRIERAKQYLVHTDMSVLDISLALGFNPNYFSRFFRQHTGYSPRDYAKVMRHTEDTFSPSA
jgi:transcriptional regulator GlxA family with amidase domain